MADMDQLRAESSGLRVSRLTGNQRVTTKHTKYTKEVSGLVSFVSFVCFVVASLQIVIAW